MVPIAKLEVMGTGLYCGASQVPGLSRGGNTAQTKILPNEEKDTFIIAYAIGAL